MKKVLKYLGILLLVLIISGLFAGFLAHDSLPENGQAGDKADALARKMEHAVNKAAWDETRFVSWQFRTGTSYMWDKAKQAVLVEWGQNKVLLYTPDRSGIAYVDGQEIKDESQRAELLAKAWSQFANDSFWLCAPMKSFDPGTRREIITTEDGQQGLMVHYTSGGVTPGDSYLWLLKENGMPYAWRMWVNIIPIGGLEFTWEDWTGGGNRPFVAQEHVNKLLNVPITELTYPSFTAEDNPLRALWATD